MEQDDSEDDIIQEVPEYSPKSEFSKARLVEQAVNTCLVARAAEMKPGYSNTTLSKDGSPITTWIPDSRDKFFSTIYALMSLLAPEIERDKKIKEAIKYFENGIEEAEKNYVYEELEPFVVGETVKYRKTGVKYMPQIDSKVCIKYVSHGRLVVNEVAKGWNHKINAFKDEMLPIYDYLFSELNKLIDRVNYFKSSAGF